MSRKVLIGAIVAACLMFSPMSGRAATDGTGTIGVTVTVDNFAEWGDAVNNYTIAAADFSGHITTAGQTRTATRGLTLYTNVTVAVNASSTAGAPNYNGTLTNGAYTLTTAYSLTGAAVTPTPGLLAPAAFLAGGNTYTVTHTAGTGSYTVTLTVTAASSATSAPDAGDYSCGLALTATW